mgnify:CR=1 FL=1
MSKQPTWMGVALISIVYLIPVLWGLITVGDADLWWHLSVGEWVVEHGKVPTHDPFSVYGQSKEWVAYSWLFEVVLFKLYSWFGLCGVLIYRAGVPLLIIVACHRLIRGRESGFLLALFLTSVAAFAMSILMQERPWLLTILFAILTQMTVLNVREERRSILTWILPLIYVIWANVHIQFVYGFLLLGLGCVMPSPGQRKLILVAILCFLATFVNPYHVKLYRVVMEYGSQTWAFQIVEELKAFSFRHHWGWATFLLTILSTFHLGRQERPSGYQILLLLCCAFFSFRAQRDLWMVVIAALTILPGFRIGDRTDDTRFEVTPLRGLLIALVMVICVTGVIFAKRINNETLRAQIETRFPEKAIQEIRKRGLKGPMFNHFNWGGYLIWRLREIPVAIDGRTNLHGGERVLRSIRTWAGAHDWHENPELKRANLVVASRFDPLTSILRLDKDWTIAYEDQVAVVFSRSGQ